MSTALSHVTDDNFAELVLKSDIPVLVDYWAPWCGPCQLLDPVLQQLAEDYKNRIAVFKLDIDENPLTPPKYGVRGTPTLMLFKEGNVEAIKVGALPISKLAAFIDNNI